MNKLDVAGNVLLSTGIAEAVISSPGARLALDSTFFLLPFALLASVRSGRLTVFISVFTALFNMLYAYVFSIFTWVSIEVFTACIFVPSIFASRGIRGNYYLLHCVRLIFLLIFLSTAFWKIRSGGLFNVEQFSAVLLRQHASILVSGSGNWFSQFLAFMISHPAISYSIYLFAFVLELVFIVGFFTRRFDTFLAICFLLFVVFDYLLMEINYFPWTPFLGCLYFSRFTEPESNTRHS